MPDAAGSPSAATSPSAALRARLCVPRASFDVSVDLDLAPGERVALLGPNGAGKSTVLGALAGTEPLQDGRISVTVNGTERVLDAPKQPSVPAFQRGITLVQQRSLLFPHLDLRSNVAFGPRSHGVPRREALKVAEDWLERVGLADRARQRPYRLSGGQQQRVALARAFAAQPHILLLDEPFAALDAESTPAVRGLLARELARSGTTSILVTHHLPDAWQLADRCLVLVEGRIVESATPTELATTPRSRFGAVLAGFAVVDGVAEDGGLRVGESWLPGSNDPVRPPQNGQPALGVVSPGDVDVVGLAASGGGTNGETDRDAVRDITVLDATGRASRATPRGVVRGVVETVEVRAGLIRIGVEGGLAAEVTPDRLSQACPGGTPRAGDTLHLRPRGLRLIAANA